MDCENCNKEIQHKKGHYIVTNGLTEFKLSVCSSFCGNALLNKLY